MGSLDETLGTDPGLAQTQASLAEGSTLGAYRIERLLGEGAMGEVYLATHIALGRPVALKTLKAGIANRALLERFFAEAKAVNIIRHENIVECTDLVNDPNGRSYIVMELLEGKTLGAAIEEGGRLPVRRAARIAAQIADAIGAAHGKGIVHRDLKPDNVFLIRRAGSADYVKVLDFGIARLRPDLGVSATQSGALIGTPAYMSPEQVRGEKVGPSADIYALGAIVFHMLTGRLPFAATSMSMMLIAQLQETPPRVDELVPDVPRALADFVARALAKDAKLRPADMATFRRDVLAAAGLPTDPGASLAESSSALTPAAYMATMPPGTATAGQSSISASAGQMLPPQPSKKRAWVIGMIAGAIAAGGVATAVIVMSSSAASPSKPTDTAAQQPVAIAEPAKQEPAKQEPAKQEPAKQEPVKQEPPAQQQPAVVDPPAPKPDEVKTVEPRKQEPAKQEPAKQEPPKPVKKKPAQVKQVPTPPKPKDPPKQEPPKPRPEPQVVTAPPPPPPPAEPQIDCSLDGFVRVYESCSDKGAASAALKRLVQCRNASKLSSKVDYDVVKRALVRCI